MNFLNTLNGSIFISSTNLFVSSFRRCRKGLTQQRGLFLRFFLSRLHNKTQAAAQSTKFSRPSILTTEDRTLFSEHVREQVCHTVRLQKFRTVLPVEPEAKRDSSLVRAMLEFYTKCL